MVGSISLASEVLLLLLVPTSTTQTQIKCAKEIVRYPHGCEQTLSMRIIPHSSNAKQKKRASALADARARLPTEGRDTTEKPFYAASSPLLSSFLLSSSCFSC